MLRTAIQQRGRVDRDRFLQYYATVSHAPHRGLQTKIITQSLYRLIEHGLLIGHGYRTPEKWFIETVTLTSAGRKAARKALGEQQALPLHVKKR